MLDDQKRYGTVLMSVSETLKASALVCIVLWNLRRSRQLHRRHLHPMQLTCIACSVPVVCCRGTRVTSTPACFA
jgi:hypothetical protein